MKRQHYFQVHKNKRPIKQISVWNNHQIRRVIIEACMIISHAVQLRKRQFEMPKYKYGRGQFNEGGIIGEMDLKIKSKKANIFTTSKGDKFLATFKDEKLDSELKYILEKQGIEKVSGYSHFNNQNDTIEKGKLN